MNPKDFYKECELCVYKNVLCAKYSKSCMRHIAEKYPKCPFFDKITLKNEFIIEDK